MPATRKRLPETGDVVYTDFEVWCGICGYGICHTTSYRKGTNNHFEVYCQSCLDERDALLDDIENLQSELWWLKEERRLEELNREQENAYHDVSDNEV